jgi:tetratricopeptide (TPR) repeat protein
MALAQESPQALYRAGQRALKQGDRADARRNLAAAVHRDPHFVDAWIALVRACDTHAEQLYCLEKMQRFNGTDPRIQEAYRRFKARHPAVEPARLAELPKSRRKQARFDALLQQADDRLADGDDRNAVRLYGQILQQEPTHQAALAGGLRALSHLRRLDDARRWAERSIYAGNEDPSAYISLAELRLHTGEGDPWAPIQALHDLPAVRTTHLLRASRLYGQHGYAKESLEMLHAAENLDPQDQAVLMQLAETYREMRHPARALHYLQRVTDQSTRTEIGQAAEEVLLEVKPHIPRYIQVSMRFALREVLGIFILFVLLALLDGGMRLDGLGAPGLIGVGLSVIGGYLLVTATSSPAQRIFARWLGDPGVQLRQPDNPRDSYLPAIAADDAPPQLSFEVRTVLGTLGAVLLVIAAILVLHNSLSAMQETLVALNNSRLPPYIDNWLDQWANHR